MDLESIPLELFSVERYEDFVTFLRSLPIPTKDKVYIFIDWSKEVGYSYSREDLSIFSIPF